MSAYLADTDASLDSIAITEQDVMDQLASLEVNKAYGPDGLSPRILKEGRNVIGPLLCKLFNLSLEKGNVPLIWKRTNVVPIHKKERKDIVNNYWPVSLLNCFAKMFEKIVFKYVFNNFKDNFPLLRYRCRMTLVDLCNAWLSLSGFKSRVNWLLSSGNSRFNLI